MNEKIKILLVEDEAITAMHLKVQLKKLGFPVVNHVTTGENAIISANEDPPDLILMDIRLAGEIDGIDAAAEIISKQNTPVIFITSYGDDLIRNRAEALSPIGHLDKPIEIYRLNDIITGYFDDRSSNSRTAADCKTCL